MMNHRQRAITRQDQEAEFRFINDGSAAAWAAWPEMPRNPHPPGSLEREAWGYGARVTHRARGDRDYCPALHS